MVILTIVILTYVVSVINRSNLEVSEVNLRIVGGLTSYIKNQIRHRVIKNPKSTRKGTLGSFLFSYSTLIAVVARVFRSSL